jgi:NADH-quinone oxidoreductase subunit M
MMKGQAVQIVLVAIPLMGAALGLLVWSKPRQLKAWSLFVAVASLLMLVGLSGRLTVPVEGMALLYLLPVVAGLSLLGQPIHRDNRPAWVMTLVLLGLGLGVLGSMDGVKLILFVLLFGLVGALLYRYRSISGSVPWWGIGTYGLGMACAIVALIAIPPVSSVAFLVSCAILLPLVPFHGGYVAAFRGLPGNLPAFLALLLPSLGFHGLLTLIPGLSESTVQTLVILAMAGMLYGSLKALTQSRVRLVLAYAGLSFFSILWWYLAVTRTAPPQTVVYLSSVGLATSGLLLAWYAIQSRYGDVDLRAIRGLVYRMPRFAVLISLLALAAMGLPPFGLFSGFMGMLLAPSLIFSGALLVVLVTWLAASWYILEMVQGLLFGPQRLDLWYADLRRTEFASLLICVLLLIALGFAPSCYFESGTPMSPSHVVMEFLSWNK